MCVLAGKVVLFLFIYLFFGVEINRSFRSGNVPFYPFLTFQWVPDLTVYNALFLVQNHVCVFMCVCVIFYIIAVSS